jgi:predicted nucleic acid-binding protein
VFVPTYWAWKEAGRILSGLVGKVQSVPPSLVNDTLLAMSCRESGVVLITGNLRDFERIAKFRNFDFVSAWP